ncbi:MAG: DNA translocase FtsK 4TM domain-containing protein, partial [Frankiaceae bacterium]|nr:DNA translocase FtsK 4TM domain-containing protein [Frankiaceae bacterium]MBV9369618.1 DNA translocase FtsK 4TM domain-containing protein [Frankiales bacterium]
MATRTPARPRPSTRSSGPSTRRPASAGTTTRAPAPRKAGGGRKPAARKPTRHGPGLPVRLIRALARLLAGIWMLLAHAAGGIARHLGNGARDLEPAQRRDGVGLAALASALVVAVGAWASAGGPVGHGVTIAVRTLVGSAVMILPPLLAFVAWRLLRTPATDAPRGRSTVGWLAASLGILGLLDLLHGDPTTGVGRRGAGGIIGVLAGSPLKSAVTVYLAVPLLLLVTAFGLVVVSGTPLHAIPQRIRGLRHAGSDPATDAADDAGLDIVADEPVKKRSRRKDKKEVIDLTAAESAPFSASPLLAERAPVDPSMLDTGPIPIVVPPAPVTEAPKKTVQMALGDGTYQLPNLTMLREGPAAKARSKANDIVIESLTQVFGEFEVDASVTGFSRGPTVT